MCVCVRVCACVRVCVHFVMCMCARAHVSPVCLQDTEFVACAKIAAYIKFGAGDLFADQQNT